MKALQKELKQHWWMYLSIIIVMFTVHLFLYRDTDQRWFYWLVLPTISGLGIVLGLLYGNIYRNKHKDFRESIDREMKNLRNKI